MYDFVYNGCYAVQTRTLRGSKSGLFERVGVSAALVNAVVVSYSRDIS